MKKVITIALFLAFVAVPILSFVPQPICAMTGSGTPADPYVIYNVTDLQDMEDNLSACYQLNNDIDASDTWTWWWDGSKFLGFDPVGYDTDHPFTGTFNGTGHVIYNLYINRPAEDYIGVFGRTFGAVIRDVELTCFNITGDDNVGSLMGFGGNSSTIENIYTSGNVSGGADSYYVGGLAGAFDTSNITNCQSAANVTNPGQDDTGGFCGGDMGDNNFTRCWAVGTVSGTDVVGDFTGQIYGGSSFLECFAIGNVTATGDYVGGWGGGDTYIAGTTISKCFATGNVTSGGSGATGGFLGGISDSVTISNCYARGNVVATSCQAVGGFIGLNGDGTTSYAYSTGFVNGDSDVGGFCGINWGTVSHCFWDEETSGTVTSDGGVGLTTLEAKTEYIYTDDGWDFTTIWAMDMCMNDGYPFFLWHSPWYAEDYDIYQVLWFQPNAIIEGTTLPDRAGTENGIITWGANPAGIAITLGDFVPEEEYEFEPIIPVNPDIIKPEPEVVTGDVDVERLRDNPLYPLVQILSIDGFLNERLVWLGIAWFTVVVAMLGVHLGFDTRKNTEKPQHFILTTITGLGLSIIFYTMGIFPLWVIIMMGILLGGAIVWERQPVI